MSEFHLGRLVARFVASKETARSPFFAYQPSHKLELRMLVFSNDIDSTIGP